MAKTTYKASKEKAERIAKACINYEEACKAKVQRYKPLSLYRKERGTACVQKQ